jgi:hypothetical protein
MMWNGKSLIEHSLKACLICNKHIVGNTIYNSICMI